MTVGLSHLLAERLGLDDVIGLAAEPIVTGTLFAALAPRLPSLLQCAVAKRQREFLSGRYCAARALTQAGYTGDGWLPLGPDRLPLWPSGWVGSISHSRSGAVALAARDSACGALGVDMEPLIRGDLAAEIAPLVATPAEIDVLAAVPEAWRLTLLFSAKEALYKALYPLVRQFQDFGAARVCAFDGSRLRLRLTRRWSSCWLRGAEVAVRYTVHEGHVYSVACLDR